MNIDEELDSSTEHRIAVFEDDTDILFVVYNEGIAAVDLVIQRSDSTYDNLLGRRLEEPHITTYQVALLSMKEEDVDFLIAALQRAKDRAMRRHEQ